MAEHGRCSGGPVSSLCESPEQALFRVSGPSPRLFGVALIVLGLVAGVGFLIERAIRQPSGSRGRARTRRVNVSV